MAVAPVGFHLLNTPPEVSSHVPRARCGAPSARGAGGMPPRAACGPTTVARL